MAEHGRARLFCPLGACRGASFEIVGEATIGRGEGHEIALDHQAISKDHARIVYDPDAGRFVLEDLGSTNGTALDGIPIEGRERLGHLHVITFAERHDFVFQDLERCAERHGAAGVDAAEPRAGVDATRASPLPLEVPGIFDRPASAGYAAGDAAGAEPREHTEVVKVPPVVPGIFAQPVSVADAVPVDAEPREHTEVVKVPPAIPGVLEEERDGPRPDAERSETTPPRFTDTGSGVILGETTRYRLEVELEDGKTRRFPLRSGDNLVGRGRAADVRLDSRHLSRRHAMVRVLGSTVTLRDEGSRNHTFLEGQRIGAAVPIEPGDRLRFGGIEARLVLAPRRAPTGEGTMGGTQA